jgi:hypothetical protein
MTFPHGSTLVPIPITNPANQHLHLGGYRLSLDADQDTYIISDTDDQIQLFAGGAEIVEFDATSINVANTRFALSGTLAAAGIQGFLINPTMTSTGGGISMFGVGGTHIPAAGQSAYGSAFGTTIVEGGSGTHTDLAGVLVYALDITAAGGATTNGTSLKVLGAPTEATNNYALWVADGDVQLDSPVTVGGTHSIGGRQAFRINGTYTTTGGGYSVFTSGGTLIPANGETAYGAVFNTVIEEGSGGTHGDFAGLFVPTLNITADAGGTVTNAATFKIGGAPTEATNNYAVHVDAGQVKIATSTVATSATAGALVVTGGIGVAGNSYFGDQLFTNSGVSQAKGLTVFGSDAKNATNMGGTNNQSVATGVATEIGEMASIASNGGLALVCGHISSGADTSFLDLLLVPQKSGGTVAIIQHTATRGSPVTASYALTSERVLKITQASGSTYDVNVHWIAAVGSPL